MRAIGDSAVRTHACVTVIINPVSGAGDCEARQASISDALSDRGYTCQFFATAPDVEVKATVKEAIQNGAELILVAGGDGTVMQVIAALIDTDVLLAIIPSGTGNLLALNLGIPTSILEAVEIALDGAPCAIDLARVRTRAVRAPSERSIMEKTARQSAPENRNGDEWQYFAIMGGIGLDAHMIRDADRSMKRTWGVLAYLGAILKNLRRRASPVSVSIDGNPPIRRRIKTVLVANMGKVIGGLAAFPNADPADGVLDIGLIMSSSIGAWLRLLWMALCGRPHDSPSMDVFRGKHIVIRSSAVEPVELDGEICGYTNEMTIEAMPRAVSVMLPAISD